MEGVHRGPPAPGRGGRCGRRRLHQAGAPQAALMKVGDVEGAWVGAVAPRPPQGQAGGHRGEVSSGDAVDGQQAGGRASSSAEDIEPFTLRVLLFLFTASGPVAAESPQKFPSSVSRAPRVDTGSSSCNPGGSAAEPGPGDRPQGGLRVL